jgi:hypothetical protein
VAFCTEIAFEGNRTPYRFTGRLGEDGTLAGDLDCGEYGCATWTAHRRDE